MTAVGPGPPAKLVCVKKFNDGKQRADVVFIHGVDGRFDETWHPSGKPDDYWPEWLGEDIEGINIWSLDYPASTTKWRGSTMHLEERASNVLTILQNEGFAENPDVPLVFVTHSFGGLLTKQMLSKASISPNEHWRTIGARYRGVSFLATPNSGSTLADFLSFVASALLTVTVDDLKDSSPHLLDLNDRYRELSSKRGIETQVFYETRKTKVAPLLSVQVVSRASADPGIPGIERIPVDADHLTICKPESKDALVYKAVRGFIEGCLLPMPPCEMPRPSQDDPGGDLFPDPEKLQTPPAVEPEQVTLVCRNATGEPLRIALYDWYRHYNNQVGRWRFLEPPINGEEFGFQDFHAETSQDGTLHNGWFSVYAVTPGCQVSECLGTFNAFRVSLPRVVIEGGEGDYTVSYE